MLSPPSIPRRGALVQGTEPPTASQAPQHKWLSTAPGVCSWCVCVCVHCWVCALRMGKCRAWISSMGHHAWLYVTSLSHSLSRIKSELHDTNSQLRVKVQFWGGEDWYILRIASLYLKIMTLYLTIMTLYLAAMWIQPIDYLWYK